MPLSLLTNTDPIPVVMQADDPNSGKYSTKDKTGTEYGITQLLEDIKVSFDKAKYPSTDSDYKKSINKILDDAFEDISTDTKFHDDRSQWLINWASAYQKNPTLNISKKITDFIWTILDPSKKTPGGKWLVDDLFQNKTPASSFLAEDVVAQLTTFMKDLPSDKNTPPLPLNFKTLSDDMDNEIKDVLKKFQLDWNNDGKDQGVASFKSLSSQALLAIDKAFEDADVITAGRPYRDPKSFDQASVVAAAKTEFEKLYHTQEWVNTLATSAFNKAKNELDKIIKSSTVTKLDSRTLKVIEEFEEWTHKQPHPETIKTPTELFKVLLGEQTGKDFVKWFDKWKKFIQVGHTETPNPSTSAVVTFNLELKNGGNVIIKGTTENPGDIRIDTAAIKSAGKTLPQGSVSTKNIDIYDFSYSTKMLQVRMFKDIFSSITVTSTINQDNYLAYLKAAGIDPTKGLAPGYVKEGLSIADLELINPENFGAATDKDNLQSKLDKAKADFIKYFKDNFGKDITSSLTLTFGIEIVKGSNGDLELKFTPTFEDTAISTLPGIDWSTSDLIDAPQNIRDEIDNLFKDLDSKYEKITSPDTKTISQRLVSALEAKAAEAYNIFQKNKQDSKLPFEIDFNGDLDTEGDVSTNYIEANIPGAKAFLEKLKAEGRFEIHFTHVPKENGGIDISYTITDTTIPGKAGTTDVTNSIDKTKLDNIHITFNKSLDPAQALLAKLQKSKIDKSDFQTRKQVEDLGKRTKPIDLTPDELTKMFPDLSKLETEGLAEPNPVTLMPVDGVEKFTDKDGNTVYFKHFKASYSNGIKTVDHDIKIQITHNFLSQEEIDKANAQVDTDAADAHETIDKSVLPQADKDKYNQQITDEHDKLKQQIKDEGQDMSEDKLKTVLGESDAIKAMATAAAMKAKYDEVHGMLEKQFPGGNIPPEVEELFKKNWSAFEDIIKNDPSILHDISRLKELLKHLSVDSLMSAQKSMQLSGKIALLSLGSLLGVGAGIGGANAIKVATTNKKAINAKTGKIKSSKKLAVLSAFIGLASLAGSIGTMLYLFLVQGGL